MKSKNLYYLRWKFEEYSLIPPFFWNPLAWQMLPSEEAFDRYIHHLATTLTIIGAKRVNLADDIEAVAVSRTLLSAMIHYTLEASKSGQAAGMLPTSWSGKEACLGMLSESFLATLGEARQLRQPVQVLRISLMASARKKRFCWRIVHEMKRIPLLSPTAEEKVMKIIRAVLIWCGLPYVKLITSMHGFEYADLRGVWNPTYEKYLPVLLDVVLPQVGSTEKVISEIIFLFYEMSNLWLMHHSANEKVMFNEVGRVMGPFQVTMYLDEQMHKLKSPYQVDSLSPISDTKNIYHFSQTKEKRSSRKESGDFTADETNEDNNNSGSES